MTLRLSADYLAQTSVFWMESSRERRHYIRSVGSRRGEADEIARMLHTLRVKVEPGGKDP